MNGRSFGWRASVLLMLAALASTLSTRARAVDGYVDLHAHLAGEMSFGGSWFWGRANGEMNPAVARCDGNFLTRSHGALRIPILADFLPGAGDTGWHLGQRNGFDTRRCRRFFGIVIPGTCPTEHFAGWPVWDSIAHQQMWQGWLKQARDSGLRVVMVSLAESSFLCENTPVRTRRFPCDEMSSVRRQAQFVHDFANRYASWVGVATTPAQARALIAQGKLVLVLAVEVTKLFPSGDYLAQLDQLRALGVSSVQVMHHADNRFGGAAPIPGMAKAADIAEFFFGEMTRINDFVCRDLFGRVGTCDGETHLNERGLTSDGVNLVKAMMDRGMLLDVAHESRKSLVQTYDLARAHGNYPLIYSHTHMWDTIVPEAERHEKFLRADEIHMIADTGGMIGLRTGSEGTQTYGTAVANRCQGSVRSFAQSLMYAVDQGLNVGLGTDFNGFIAQMAPRYRPRTLAFQGDINCRQDSVEIVASGHIGEMQRKGLGHVGMLGEMMQELNAVGLPAPYAQHLNQSAETFLRIWERSLSLATATSTNLALNAVASASSTFCSTSVPGPDCYSPARVNDGASSTALGGLNSWANDWGQAMPQWLQLTWSAPVTFSRVEFYTTAGYELTRFSIQYRSIVAGVPTWTDLPVSPAFPVNNAVTYRAFSFPAVTGDAIRVLAHSGSALQPGYARVNELEVY